MPFRLAVSATFTAEPIERVLAFWGRQLETPFEIRFAPYNQALQTLLDPAGEFAANPQGANLLLARLEDLAQFPTCDDADLRRIEAVLHELIELIREAPRRTNVPLIFALCPPSPAFVADSSRQRFCHETARRIETLLEGTPGVFFLGHEEIQRLYPVDTPANPEGERLGRIPYTDLYFCALGTALVRITHGLLRPAFKVIALDCDNTLWRGICGEDGPWGIVVDPARRALQEFMADQREQGMLLVLASKNNERDVIETFERNPDMPLQLRHFAAWRLNWDPKSANLRDMAAELSLGIDSFILVDDSPKECAEVEESVPETLALTLPANESEISRFLEHVWAFDHLVVTEEDRHRNAYYAQAQEFGRELKKAATLEHFAETLDVRVRFEALTPERLARVAQLTQRTNQFNLTTIRRSESEIWGLADRLTECVTLDVADRFGEYGLTGVVFYRATHDALEIDTFLLSCRVLGRGVEHRVMAHLAEEAARRGLGFLIVPFTPTAKNEPARQFLQEIAGGYRDVYRLPVSDMIGLRWRPAARAALTQPVIPDTAPHRRPDYECIACTLATPEQILDAMRSEGGLSPADPSMSSTEGRLARIWSDLLQRPGITAADSFFDLGGHSLLAVLLIGRVREAFDVELPIDDVYSTNLTLGELAHKIEAYQRGDAAEYDALLKEIEELSDEEVRRLLAEERLA